MYTFQEVIEICKDKEVVVNKNIFKFTKSILYYLNYSFDYNHAKDLVYGITKPTSEMDQLIIKVNQSYSFIIHNITHCNREMVRTYLHILDVDNICDEVYEVLSNIEMDDKYFSIIINAYIKLLKIKCEYNEIIALGIFNVLLVKVGIVAIKFDVDKINSFKKIVDIYKKDKDSGLELLSNMIVNNPMQGKEYYENLISFTTDDLVSYLVSNKERIWKTYKINQVSLFGSFANKTNRIDSDIDLIVHFEEDISYDDKVKLSMEFKEMMFTKFKRFVDISEYLYTGYDIRESKMINII